MGSAHNLAVRNLGAHNPYIPTIYSPLSKAVCSHEVWVVFNVVNVLLGCD